MTMLRHQSVSETPLITACIAESREQGHGAKQTANVRDTASQEVNGKSRPSQYLHGLTMAPFA